MGLNIYGTFTVLKSCVDLTCTYSTAKTFEKLQHKRRAPSLQSPNSDTQISYFIFLKDYFVYFVKDYMTAMMNNPDVPSGLAGKESIIFGNIEDIFDFHNKYVYVSVFDAPYFVRFLIAS